MEPEGSLPHSQEPATCPYHTIFHSNQSSKMPKEYNTFVELHSKRHSEDLDVDGGAQLLMYKLLRTG